MQWIDGQAVYSATDLVGFIACEHLTDLEKASLAGLVWRPTRPDPELDRIVQRGRQHEVRFLGELRASGQSVREILPDGSIDDHVDRLTEAARLTREAIVCGDDVIYQATFFDGRRRGHADFLLRVQRSSDLGPWSYEVWDTKLARHAKASAVVQLCFYSDLLTDIQGVAPEHMWLALGGSQAEKIAFRVNDYSAYYRVVAREFERFLGASEPTYPPSSLPDPVQHCDVCR